MGADADRLTFADIQSAQKRLAGNIVHTPCLPNRPLSRIVGAEVYLKFENRQIIGAFKERGALNKLLCLSQSERDRGVIAASSGNHAQAVAYHASRLKVRAVIVMPKGTPMIKVCRTQAYGAEVVLEGDTFDEASRFTRERASREGLTFIHPFDDPQVITGQGTVAVEMLNDVSDLDVLLVQIGGGGLIAGCAIAAKALKPGIRIVGVESKTYSAMYQRLKGLPVQVGGDTIAEGLAVRDIGEIPLGIVRKLVDEVLLVEETTIERAIVTLIEEGKTVAEGAGATGLAALLEHPRRFTGKRVGLVITGGNIDSRLLSMVLMRGLIRDGKLVRLRILVPDRPGGLTKVTALINSNGGHIIEAQYDRIFVPSVKTPAVELLVETRDWDHVQALVKTLRDQGVQVMLLTQPAL
ncbi:MAG: threonine ammonia-lyase [Deltaproteobacteria bacterium]|nr:threonine ammonia-lyase [Deltaproteobacteria bacterium]